MAVSTRNTLLVSAGAFSAIALAGFAFAGGGSGGGHGPAVVPGAGMSGSGMGHGGGSYSGRCSGKNLSRGPLNALASQPSKPSQPLTHVKDPPAHLSSGLLLSRALTSVSSWMRLPKLERFNFLSPFFPRPRCRRRPPPSRRTC